MPPTFDIWDQAVLTELINEPVQTALEEAPFLGTQIAPEEDIRSRMARMDVGKTYSFGIGQFKAPNAMPALVEMPVPERREAMIELVQLEELHRINSEQWMRLQSNDDNVRNAEGLSVVERGQILQRRNERLAEWMRWQAFQGMLTVTYPRTNSQLVIDYGFLPGHLPTVATLWTDLVNADPVADIDAWQQLLSDDSGHVGLNIHLTTKTAKLITQNQKLKSYFNVDPGKPFRATLADVATLLADGTKFIVNDSGYRPIQSGGGNTADSDHTRYLAHNRVLVTTSYSIEGEQIADTLNGEVEISTGYNQTDIQIGPSAEVILDHMTKNRYLRQASAKIPRIIHPECFLYATVGA